ncbi:MAG: phytanoyl-CoA dioxygenase family protein [Chloroflexota bacterium]
MTLTHENMIARRLTTPEIQSFRRNGYLILHNVLPLAELATLNTEMEARYQARLKDPEIALNEEKRNQIHGLGVDSERSQNLARDPRILALIEDLVQPGIALFSAKLISKGPHEPNNVCHWHQDEAYWHIYSQSRCRMSIWLPLQDTTKENGCLRVIPGTHRKGIIPHKPRSSRDHGACRLSFLPGERELPNTVYCEIPAGSVVLFSNKLCHSSLGNHTNQHRRAFILTYQEAIGTKGKDKDFAVLRPATETYPHSKG